MGILRGRQEQKQYLKQQWLEFPQVMSDTKPHIQEAQGTLNRINTKTKQKQNQKPHIDIIFKLQKIKGKEKHLKEKEYLSYREAKIKITFNLSQDTMKAKIKWREIFKIQRLKKKNRPRILYPVKLFCKSEGETKCFSDKKWKEFVASSFSCKKC